MPGRPPRALCPVARSGQFGSARDVVVGATTIGSPVNLFNIDRDADLYSGEAALLAINIDVVGDNRNATGGLPVGELDIVASLRWGTGKATLTAEIDVPAGGTVVVVAASDLLIVDLFRAPPAAGGLAASNATDIVVRGTLGFASSPGGFAQRTIQVGVLPQAARLAIPKFARDAVTLPDTFGALAPPAGTLRFFGDRAGVPSMMIVAAPVPPTEPCPIPDGARFFDITGIAGTAARALFRLSL